MTYPNINAEMARRGLTPRMLARELGLSVRTVRSKLVGRREFTLAEIEQLARRFDCSLDYLVGHTVPARSLAAGQAGQDPQRTEPASL